MLYRLIFLTGSLKGQRITADSEPMTIGRDDDCSIKIADSEVASKHASLEHNSLTGLRISDLGSMNKILVNNREVREAHLKHGDIVELGRTRFLVQASVETDPTKSAPKRRRRVSLTPLLIIVPMMAIIYGIISFCQKIINESTPPNPVPLNVAVSTNNPLHKHASLSTNKPDIKPAATPTAQETLKPISDEIRRMSEDLAGIKQTVSALTVKQPVSATTTVHEITKPIAQTTTQQPPAKVQGISTAATPLATKPQAPAKVERSDPGIKINYLEQQKFKENEDFDEMRIITIGLQKEWPVKDMDEDEVRIEISFFDQSEDGKSIVPTRAITPTKPLTPSQWIQDTQSTVTAAYVIPKGSRIISSQTTAPEQFYGYVVRAYYRNKLQDEDARPKNLLHYSSGTLKKIDQPGNSANAHGE